MLLTLLPGGTQENPLDYAEASSNKKQSSRNLGLKKLQFPLEQKKIFENLLDLCKSTYSGSQFFGHGFCEFAVFAANPVL